MFSKKKNASKLDAEQRELYENARRRNLQKKRLFQHFVIFLIGAVFLIILNVVIGYQEQFMPLGYNWFVWAILLWSFILILHLFNVFVTNKFMGKEWEARQMERLVNKQKEKIAEMEKQVERDHPAKPKDKSERESEIRRIDPGPDFPTYPDDPDQPYNT